MPDLKSFITFLFLILTALVFFAGLSFIRGRLVPWNSTPENRDLLLTGDEPEYFLAAWSLAHDGDMNLRNNLLNEDSKKFQNNLVCDLYHGGREYFKRVSPSLREGPEAWKDLQLLVHRPGTAALIAPAAWFPEKMRWLAYAIISLLVTFCSICFIFFAGEAGVSFFMSVALTFLFVFSPPGVFYANQAFPEIPVAMLLTLASMLLWRPSPLRLYVACVLLVLIPWFSDRAIPAAGILALYAFFLAPGPTRWGLVLIFSVGAILLMRYYYFRFGVLWPLHHNPFYSCSVNAIVPNLPKLFFDAGRGIFWLFPALLLYPLAFVRAFRLRQYRFFLGVNFLMFVLSVCLVASFPDWRAGVCPAGRYGVLLQWLAFPVILLWVRAGIGPVSRVFLFVLLAFSVVEIIFLIPYPCFWYRNYHPLFGYECLQPYYDFLPQWAE